MSWATFFIEANVIAFIVMVHASLLFCEPSACAADFGKLTSLFPSAPFKFI